MGDRVILHSDINCCYASIEHLHHPELAGKPLAVGGDPEARHGIVLTADYIAKKYGVKTGMALWQAKQVCPDITFVSPRMDLYLRFSRMAHEIYAEYTDRQEPYGIDECWLDVTGSSSLKGDGLLIAQEISRRMKSELGITVSVGVSFNKIFAKLGSDYKKPDAITTMYKSEFKQKAWSLPVADVKYSDVLFFYTDLINNQGLQINTLETINTVLRPTFQLAVRDDIIRKNPVDGAYCEVKKRNGGARKTRRALTVDQQRKFMEYVAKNPFFYHWYPFFVFLLGTGCRIGEAIGIRWDDIDLENRIIDINHSLTYYQRADDSYKCEFRVSLPKTEAGNRRIPMMQQVYDVLQEEYERQKQEGFCVENVDGMTNFVFTNRFGMPHNPAAVNRAIKRIVDTHNSEEEVAAKKEKREPVMIPRFSCHIFRHTFASRFCENETNIKVIQEVMGHADVSTTMNIYAEANPDVTKSVIEKLSKNMDIF